MIQSCEEFDQPIPDRIRIIVKKTLLPSVESPWNVNTSFHFNQANHRTVGVRLDRPKLLDRDKIGVMSLPFMKLGTLALRTLSKPIAVRLKKEAAINPNFRTAIMAVAQANHRFTTTVQRRIYGRDTDVKIRPLDEERAVQVAGDLIGELFVFTIMRQRDENLAKQMELLELKLVELEKTTKAQALVDSQTKEVKRANSSS
ncbi:Optic atrophy 3-like protein [Cynara cardunculus var. scolymus]|uniref:Optic atrophy 3-like protein n=1 Tax=Cynara cardunculus var. scolymus TaxID=59895 RepID=A0A118JTD6_CYNCS|nr:Optic atrophy 3-like protein [Cynara cardunculus var. scolymus]